MESSYVGAVEYADGMIQIRCSQESDRFLEDFGELLSTA